MIHLYKVTQFIVIYLSLGDAAGQFHSVHTICLGDTFSFNCTVTGDMNGYTNWRVNGSSECTLSHTSDSSSPICGPNNVFRARPIAGFGANASSFLSTLSGIATSTLNGTLIECFGPDNSVDPENRVDSSILQIIGQHIKAARPITTITLNCDISFPKFFFVLQRKK